MCIVIGYEKRKARKKHICSLCGAPITAGETYARWLNIDGGVLENETTPRLRSRHWRLLLRFTRARMASRLCEGFYG